MPTLTTANASIVLSCPSVFPAPIPIYGFAADDAIASASVKPVETRMGVDGKLSAGYVAYPTPFGFTLQPDSPSVITMDMLLAAFDSANETYPVTITVTIPGISKVFDFTQGWLVDHKKVPDGKKLLEPQKYEFMFENCFPAPI